MEITKDLLLKLKETKTADELLDLAKANGAELTKESAEKLFTKFNESCELTDEMLNHVAGGLSHISSR